MAKTFCLLSPSRSSSDFFLSFSLSFFFSFFLFSLQVVSLRILLPVFFAPFIQLCPTAPYPNIPQSNSFNMDAHPDNPLLQTFRCRSTGEVLDIPTLLDPTTGKRMVFWEDILSGFKNAESVRNGKSLVSFLRDENQKR